VRGSRSMWPDVGEGRIGLLLTDGWQAGRWRYR